MIKAFVVVNRFFTVNFADMASVYILTYEIETLQKDVKFNFEIIFGEIVSVEKLCLFSIIKIYEQTPLK